MRIITNDKEVAFITDAEYGMNFWTTVFPDRNGNPYICMSVSGEGHASVRGRYDQRITVEELKKYIDHLTVLYDAIKHLDTKNQQS